MRIDFSNNKMAYGFWALRWLLLPLLFYVFGDFLEGPPTRVVVRSIPFVLVCILLPGLTAQFLYQVHRLPRHIVTSSSLFITCGFIYFSQLYYNGSKDKDYELLTTIFFILMCLVGLVYLYSLFVIKPKSSYEDDEESEDDDWESVPFTSYEIILYYLDSEEQRGKVVLRKQGSSELPEYLVVDGFSKDCFIDLSEYWDEIINDECEHYSTDLTTYETIVKFGDTMQLVNNYQIVFNLTY